MRASRRPVAPGGGPRAASGGAASGKPPVEHHHNLFVLGDNPKALPGSLRVLNFIKENRTLLREMGVEVKPYRVLSGDLSVPEIVGLLKAAGVTSFPALKTSQNVYLGPAPIIQMYEKNINDYQAFKLEQSTGAAPSGGARRPPSESEGDLADYLRDEMGGVSDVPGMDSDEEDIGGEGDMGASLSQNYQAMMRQRESRSKPARASSGTASHSVTGGGPAERAERASPGPSRPTGRADNLASHAATLPASLSRLASEGGDEEEDDGDPQDDLLSEQYWDNQEDSLAS